MTDITQNTVTEQVFENYTWMTFTGVCTGKPEYNVYFPAKVVDGEQWNSVFETRVAVNAEDGSVEWHRVRVYDELADMFNKYLKEGNRVARLNCQGYLKQRVITDSEDNQKVIPFMVIPNKKDEAGNYKFFKVLATWQHSRGADGEDPFAEADGKSSEDQTADARAEAERKAQAEEVLEQNRVDAHAEESVEEVSPEEFGFSSMPMDEQDAPF